jgi:hypothetical protein
MTKRKLKTKKYKKSKNIKNNKSRKYKSKGGNNKVKCSMCEKMVNKDKTLVPSECLLKHGKSAHRICDECWWDPNIGFARENASHRCPGCIKGLPLTKYTKEPPIIIELSDD